MQIQEIKPFMPANLGGDVLVTFDDGQSLVVAQDVLLDRENFRELVARRLRSTLQQPPGEWENFVVQLYRQSTGESPPPEVEEPQPAA